MTAATILVQRALALVLPRGHDGAQGEEGRSGEGEG